MLAMIKLWKSEVLKSLKWKLLLQIHDEVILEGPKETMPEVRTSISTSTLNFNLCVYDNFLLKRIMPVNTLYFNHVYMHDICIIKLYNPILI